MKRNIFILVALICTLIMASCGADRPEKPAEYEIAMIADSSEIKDGSFTQCTWESVEGFASTNGLTSKCYTPEESTKEAYLDTIKKAVDNKAKMIVLAGSNFETAAFSAQSIYPDVNFLLIDGVPHDTGDKYGAASNTIGVIFAEEQAGYMAGYAAVKDGYHKLGFMGGKSLPPVKRYGYGFVQGAAAAAQELEQKVEITYKYMETFEPSDDVKAEAAKWYEDGVKVIFACGGNMGNAVMDAAEECRGKVIGADNDQSYLSGTVITSAQKEIDVVVNDMLSNYADDKYVGGTAFNYTAQNGGVSLQMDNAKFTSFGKNDYEKLFNKLKNGKIELKKDTGVNDVSELTGEWVTIK
ncbi:MAG: BMP family ABC transporter substrate-binding protein [Firmicutes bacterium]|nr:BMP family ABC transporter substrate-binding protein [Bacillota bacterium]